MKSINPFAISQNIQTCSAAKEFNHLYEEGDSEHRIIDKHPDHLAVGCAAARLGGTLHPFLLYLLYYQIVDVFHVLYHHIFWLSISNFPLSSIIDFRTLSAQLMSPYSLFS
jgi:hypothetical protein